MTATAPRVSASLFVTDHSVLGETVERAIGAGADAIHVDVMDGRFTPEVAFGANVVAALRGLTDLCLDVHLQIVDPRAHIEAFAAAGADVLTFHYEVTEHAHQTILDIQELGMRAGVALNPGTPAGVLEDLAVELDMALVMTTNPGGSGFVEGVLPKIGRVRQLIDTSGRDVDLAVDGGIDAGTATRVVDRGADWLISGSALFKSDEPIETVMNALRSVGGAVTR